MAQQSIDIGTTADDGTGDTLRDAFDKSNDNFTELYSLIDALGISGVKQACRVATTAAGTLASDFENGDTVDGVTLATDDRILIKDQAAGAENGIYTINTSGAPTRATDADSEDELAGAAVFIQEGTANADKLFQCTTDAPITVDTTALTFAEFSGGGGGSATGDITEIVKEYDFAVDGGQTDIDVSAAELGSFDEIIIIFENLAAGTFAPAVRVSDDDLATLQETTGDYKTLDANGVDAGDSTVLVTTGTGNASAKHGIMRIIKSGSTMFGYMETNQLSNSAPRRLDSIDASTVDSFKFRTANAITAGRVVIQKKRINVSL